jgi:hypothetical protein
MSAQRTEAGWDRERQRSAFTQAEKSRKGRDIAPPRHRRRPGAEGGRGEELRAVLPDVLPGGLQPPLVSEDHRRAITKIETAVRDGGWFAFALPRGMGKTTLVEAAVQWATLYGYRQFPVVIGSDESSALELLDSVKSDLETNEPAAGGLPGGLLPDPAARGHRSPGERPALRRRADAHGVDGQVASCCRR